MAKRSQPAPDEGLRPGEKKLSASDVEKMIPAKKLAELLKHCRSAKADVQSINGELGSAIKAADDKYSFNKKALAAIRALDRMEPEKIADYLDHFYYMLDVSGIGKRAESAQRLEFGAGEGEEEPSGKGEEPGEGEEAAGETRRGGGSVAKFPQAAKPH